MKNAFLMFLMLLPVSALAKDLKVDPIHGRVHFYGFKAEDVTVTLLWTNYCGTIFTKTCSSGQVKAQVKPDGTFVTPRIKERGSRTSQFDVSAIVSVPGNMFETHSLLLPDAFGYPLDVYSDLDMSAVRDIKLLASDLAEISIYAVDPVRVSLQLKSGGNVLEFLEKNKTSLLGHLEFTLGSTRQEIYYQSVNAPENLFMPVRLIGAPGDLGPSPMVSWKSRVSYSNGNIEASLLQFDAPLSNPLPTAITDVTLDDSVVIP